MSSTSPAVNSLALHGAEYTNYTNALAVNVHTLF